MATDNTVITPIMYKMLPWIAAIAFFMQTLDTSILNTALPSIAHDLNESPLNMQSAVISYALTLAVFIPVSGFLADKFGTRDVFILAVFLFSLGSLCCALSQTLFWLDVSRVLQGVGGAMMVPVSRLVLIKSFKREDFLNALNASTVPGLVGPIVGPLFGGYLVEYASWHWIFLINVPVGVIGIICSWKCMPNIKGTKTSFDTMGVFLIATALIISTISLEMISQGDNFIFSSLIFILGAVFLFGYGLYARNQTSVIFPLQLFKLRTFRIGIISNFISRLGISALPFLLPLLLQVAFGYSAIQSGLMLMPMAVGSILMKSMVPPILRRFGYRRVLICNTLIVGIMMISLLSVQVNSPLILLGSLLFLIGFVNSLQFTAMNSITLADLYGDLTSSGNSLMAVNQQLAISFGIAIGAVLVRVFNYQVDFIGNDLSDAFKASFIVLGLITCVSSLIFYRLSPQDGQNLVTKPPVNPEEKSV